LALKGLKVLKSNFFKFEINIWSVPNFVRNGALWVVMGHIRHIRVLAQAI